MTGRQTLWPAGVVGLMLLLAGLGCSIYSLVPQPEPIHTPVGEATLSPKPTEVVALAPTQEPLPEPEPEMSVYANPLAGFSILYPADWTYKAEGGGVYFVEDEGVLEYFDPADGPMLAVMTVSREEVELEFGSDVTTEDLLDSMLEGLGGGEGTTIGEIDYINTESRRIESSRCLIKLDTVTGKCMMLDWMMPPMEPHTTPDGITRTPTGRIWIDLSISARNAKKD